MKKIFLAVVHIVSAYALNAQTNLILANHVAIDHTGYRFSLTDKGYINAEDREAYLTTTEIAADAPLHWVLHNDSTNDHQLRFQGINRTFSIRLFDSQGNVVPYTPAGELMNIGPKTNKNGSIPTSLHFVGALPGALQTKDFPEVQELFQITHPGNYFLKVRYWYLDYSVATNKHWQLSDPVQLKVIKSDNKPPLRSASPGNP